MIEKITDIGLWRYQLKGLISYLHQPRICPSCKSNNASVVDRKGVHLLYKCNECFLIYRYPCELASEMEAFYQGNYHEPGLTTSLPDDGELETLIATEFSGSGKDFTWHIGILEALGMKPGMTMLEYGANWGYATWQFKKAGFNVDAYELSVPRAAYGKKLGLDIETDIANIKGPYDFVYSCHVLEHVPNPREVLLWQMSLLKPGGVLVAHTPNGSSEYRNIHKTNFHKSWGLVHPVLLTDKFIQNLFTSESLYVSSDDRPESVHRWDGKSREIGNCDGDGSFFAIKNK